MEWNKHKLFSFGLDAFVILLVLLFPHYVPLPFYSYAVICLIVVLWYLKYRGQSLKDIGLKKNGLNLFTCGVGVVAGICWLAFMQWGYVPFIQHFFPLSVKSYTEYDFIKNNLGMLVMVIVAAWVIGGFYEEIVFRGFLQTTFMRWMGNGADSFWWSALLTSGLFGLYHFQQGVFGMVPAILGSLFWSVLLWRSGGNLWYVIIGHATYDTLALVMIYLGMFGK